MNGTAALHAILFLSSCLYALVLQLLRHYLPEIYDHGTVLTVVVGVAYTLAVLSLDPDGLTVERLWTAFAASGLPIAGRSLYNYLKEYRGLLALVSGSARDTEHDGHSS